MILLGSVFCLTCNVQAQKNEDDTKALLETADFYYETLDYLKALETYKKITTTTSLDPVVNFRIGICMYNLRDQRAGAGVYFEKAIWSVPQDMYSPMTVDPEVLESYYYLGQHYHLQEEYDVAITMYQTYQNYIGLYGSDNPEKEQRKFSMMEINNLISKSIYAKEHERDVTKIKVENMGEGVNSTYPDYAPIVSADGSTMIFTSRRKGTGGLLDPRGEYFEDIYITVHGEDGWETPKGIGPTINSYLHDAGIGLSLNGQELMLFRTNPSLTGGDIYNSKLQDGEWSDPTLLSSTHYDEESLNKGVNTSFIEPSACMNKEGDVLIFSSNRPGGFGGMDLYRVVKLPDGEWSFAVNLGATINTPFDEDGPYLYPDNRTLFFSSKGHRNMGGYDIFRSELKSGSGNLRSDIGLLWSIPENLKAPINSVADDIYYVLSTDGRKSYFSSDRKGGLGGSDIYMATLSETEGMMIVVKGTVISLDDNGPLSARLTVLDQENHRLKGEYNTNPETGEFVMILAPKLKYRMIVEAEGHYSITEDYFLISFADNFTILNKTIHLQPLKIEVEPTAEYLYSYVLKDVQFISQSYELLPESDSVFTTLVLAMIANPNMKIEIAGHTDDQGGQEANLELSQRQANAVKEYLITQGIDGLRLVAKGYGESMPIDSNKKEEGRARNRRIEVRVIEE